MPIRRQSDHLCAAAGVALAVAHGGCAGAGKTRFVMPVPTSASAIIHSLAFQGITGGKHSCLKPLNLIETLAGNSLEVAIQFCGGLN
jgi:hypothetical protein